MHEIHIAVIQGSFLAINSATIMVTCLILIRSRKTLSYTNSIAATKYCISADNQICLLLPIDIYSLCDNLVKLLKTIYSQYTKSG